MQPGNVMQKVGPDVLIGAKCNSVCLVVCTAYCLHYLQQVVIVQCVSLCESAVCSVSVQCGQCVESALCKETLTGLCPPWASLLLNMNTSQSAKSYMRKCILPKQNEGRNELNKLNLLVPIAHKIWTPEDPKRQSRLSSKNLIKRLRDAVFRLGLRVSLSGQGMGLIVGKINTNHGPAISMTQAARCNT